MNGEPFGEIDLDLLADYVGGALDGTPEADIVARRLADDPAWLAAYDELAHATTAVRADLSAWAAAPTPMPDDIAERLTAALTEAAAPVSAAPVPVPSGDAASDAHSGRRSGSGGSSGPASGRPTGRPAARRRMRRWAAPLALAAGVLTFAGVGMNVLLSGAAKEESAPAAATAERYAGSQGLADRAVPSEVRGVDPLAGGQVLSTGTDYRPESIAAAAAQLFGKPSTTPPAMLFGTGDRYLDSDPTAEPLRRLVPRDTLVSCLDAIATQHNRGPIAVHTVDFARFGGDPAVIVSFRADGHEWVWASGPGCGTPQAGADTRFQAQVR